MGQPAQDPGPPSSKKVPHVTLRGDPEHKGPGSGRSFLQTTVTGQGRQGHGPVSALG